jgi:hypothetical protein
MIELLPHCNLAPKAKNLEPSIQAPNKGTLEESADQQEYRMSWNREAYPA